MASQNDLKTSKASGSKEFSTDKASAERRKRLLDPEEAEAGGPADLAVCGEEDPGAALEFLVDEEEPKKKR